MKKIINSKKAPQAIGPYSQAIETDNYVFCSGQIPLNSEGSLVEGDISLQTRQVMKNLGAVLGESGISYENIVKTTIYIVDMDDFKKVNEVYSEYFESSPPARSTVEVSSLPKGAQIEIDAIAIK